MGMLLQGQLLWQPHRGLEGSLEPSFLHVMFWVVPLRWKIPLRNLRTKAGARLVGRHLRKQLMVMMVMIMMMMVVVVVVVMVGSQVIPHAFLQFSCFDYPPPMTSTPLCRKDKRAHISSRRHVLCTFVMHAAILEELYPEAPETLPLFPSPLIFCSLSNFGWDGAVASWRRKNERRKHNPKQRCFW